MRPAFHEQLDELWDRLFELATRQTLAIERATSAVLDGNLQLSELVISEQLVTDDLQTDLEAIAVRVLAQQQPVASDLRLVVSAIPASIALARMGGLAAHVAKAARMHSPEPAAADRVRGTISALGDAGADIATGVAEAINTRDAELAARVIEADDGMDALHRQLLTQCLASDWPHGVPAAVDTALLGRYYERFSDQAGTVARRVIFILTGDRAPR